MIFVCCKSSSLGLHSSAVSVPAASLPACAWLVAAVAGLEAPGPVQQSSLAAFPRVPTAFVTFPLCIISLPHLSSACYSLPLLLLLLVLSLSRAVDGTTPSQLFSHAVFFGVFCDVLLHF